MKSACRGGADGIKPALDDASLGYSTGIYGGKLWRIYVLNQGGLRIATADRIDGA